LKLHASTSIFLIFFHFIKTQKTIFTSALAALLLSSVLVLDSCKKKNEDPLAQNIQRLVPRKVIDTLRTMGMNIIETGKPVQITGVYEMNPLVLFASSNSSDIFGSVFSPLRIRFTDQNDADQSIKMDYKNGRETGSGIGGFVAGSGNKFSAFFETSGSYGSSTFKSSIVLTGEWSSNGIQNMQYALYVKEKNDPSGSLVKIGTTRAFNDKDGLANKVATFRLAADDNGLTDSSQILKSAAMK